jgi:hypothetical protein
LLSLCAAERRIRRVIYDCNLVPLIARHDRMR